MSAVTDVVRAPVGAPRSRGGVTQAVRDSYVVAKRNLRRMTRIPEIIIFGLIQPIMFVVLFSYVFGGSVTVNGSSSASGYREFLMAGIFAQTVTFATAGAGAGIADDMHKGVIDRFRSLPMTRGAVLTGRTIADLVQTTLTVLVLIVVAVLVGWRIHNGVPKAIAAFALLLLLGYAFSWIGALIGLSVRTPEAATSGGLIWLFPVTFVSIAFVSRPGHDAVAAPHRRVESVQRHRAGGTRAVRQPRCVDVVGMAHATPGDRVGAVVGGHPGGLPYACGPAIPVGDGLISASACLVGRGQPRTLPQQDATGRVEDESGSDLCLGRQATGQSPCVRRQRGGDQCGEDDDDRLSDGREMSAGALTDPDEGEEGQQRHPERAAPHLGNAWWRGGRFGRRRFCIPCQRREVVGGRTNLADDDRPLRIVVCLSAPPSSAQPSSPAQLSSAQRSAGVVMSTSKDRLRWKEVPGSIRAATEALVGGRVVDAENCAGGYSPGLASRLTLHDGRRVFVKAMDGDAWPLECGAHRTEAMVARSLPASVPAPAFIGFVR